MQLKEFDTLILLTTALVVRKQIEDKEYSKAKDNINMLVGMLMR